MPARGTRDFFFEVFESGILTILLLIAVFAFRVNSLKNRYLTAEIQERELAEKKLATREDQLSKLVGNLPGMVYQCLYDENWTIKIISQACKQITGYSPDDLIDNKVISFNDLILPEYQQPIRMKWQKCIAQNEPFEYEYPIRSASGDIKWVWERGNALFDEKGKVSHLEGYIADITTKKQAETKLKESEDNFFRSIEESPIGMRIISPDSHTEYANPALLKIFGFETLDDFNQIPATDWYTPESYQQYRVREKKRRAGLPVEREYDISIVTRVQKIKHLHVFRNKIIWNNELKDQAIYLDQTENQIAQKELLKLSRAIEQGPVSVVITDTEGNIEYVNPRFTELTGFSKKEAMGKNPRILKSGVMPQAVYQEIWSTIKSGNNWQGELINKKKNGELFWTRKSISPIINKQGKIINFISIAEDITEKKKTEEELIRAKEKAEQSDRLKSAFLANISHEIRTPMNGILGFAELLKTPDLEPELRSEFIAMIEQSGQRMLNILNDIIDLSKIESGIININLQQTNVNHTIRHLHLFFMSEAKSKNLTLNYYCDLDDDKCQITTDPTKLSQILSNLIKNAVKFTDKGYVKFGYHNDNTRLLFFVEDSGIGIPPEEKDLIFDRFHQSDMSLSRKYEGAGLGLSISKSYVEKLGGTIRVESEPGKGSRFTFDIPFNPIASRN